MKKLKDLVRERREELGLSQAQLGALAGMSQQGIVSIEAGASQRPRRLFQLAAALQMPAEDLAAVTSGASHASDFVLEKDGDELIARHRPRPRPAPDLGPATAVQTMAPFNFAAMPRDVPVLGTASGGTSGDFLMNGDTIDFVRRPPGAATLKGTFALYVTGASMYPRFDEGQLVYVSSARPPAIGDDVIVELHPEHDGEAGRGFIKRLKKRTPTKVVVEQFNPATEIEFDADEVKQILRIIPWTELLVV
ncbi:helix-turn-helix domain-containing protein [Terrihabitans rhizophilus]|uniref:Helix-turn-helix domain-containing protein n=1 Tax=Terrihabitans rhizophilus TaxID=3092662 RepID=A0ABU4RQ79_9HYPH|nr:helix-turn-helix domain-containing protein [Terrihabitans sp. PJ23]MDX6806338.1 helix-turn-helix domain-containing protein [Terrihabitans sp. PJ23]